jgi:hypothetical protein
VGIFLGSTVYLESIHKEVWWFFPLGWFIMATSMILLLVYRKNIRKQFIDATVRKNKVFLKMFNRGQMQYLFLAFLFFIVAIALILVVKKLMP